MSRARSVSQLVGANTALGNTVITGTASANTLLINGASVSTADSKLNTQITSAGDLLTLAEFRNTDYTAGTRSFLRVRNAVSAGGTGSAYFGHGQDNRTYIIANDSGRGGDIIINGGSGAVTMPSQPGFFAYRTSMYATAGVIPFTNTLYNRGNYFELSTGKFTIPVSGDYLISAYNIGSNAANVKNFGTLKNGVVIDPLTGPYTQSGGHEAQGYCFILPFVTGDYIQLRLDADAWYGDGRGGHNGFQMHLVN